MLNMIVKEEDKVSMVAAMCGDILILAFGTLGILDPTDGDRKLVKEVLATITKLRSYGVELLDERVRALGAAHAAPRASAAHPK